jgi:PBSX family phage terminase large subunit
MSDIRLTSLIAPAFFAVHRDLKERRHSYYWLKGGRGSTKSSFVSLEIVMGIMADINANATILRKVKDTISDSVFEQYLWAIEVLGVAHLWRGTRSPYRLIYMPTGQRITFKGADNPKKVRSSKFKQGYCKYIHFEELDEFGNWDDVDDILKSLVRGGDDVTVFLSYNPPRSAASWVTSEVNIRAMREDTMVHHSTYLNVPPEWLGRPFVTEAETIKVAQPERYRYVYLGESVGTGAEVFTNLTIRRIPDDELKKFDKIYRGLDFGFAANPLHYTENHYDKRRLYIFSEIHQIGMSNRAAVEAIKTFNPLGSWIRADSAEPRTIAEMVDLGLRIDPAKKGPGSVEHGIKSLQDLEEIVIDPERCPNTTREFENYELDRDKYGNLKGQYPDRDNHSIDATRYALEAEFAQETSWLY